MEKSLKCSWIPTQESTCNAMKERKSPATNDESNSMKIEPLALPSANANYDSFLVLQNFIVDKDHRRKGVASLLLAEIENRAREKGYSWCDLVSSAIREGLAVSIVIVDSPASPKIPLDLEKDCGSPCIVFLDLSERLY